jgi:pyruvate/2-oxoglutarate dehydrogenase complex dihydrolipoamide acyltransferase (E2) component
MTPLATQVFRPVFAHLHLRPLVTASVDCEFKVISLPKLSPSFKYGDFEKWHVEEGDQIEMHQLIYDVKTTSLTDTDSAQRCLEIESHEEGWLARAFVHGGEESIMPGTPLGIMVEEKDNIDLFAKLSANDFLSDSADVTGDFVYQAYTKKGA